ncbi:MAG: PHP domain-containing protein [Clostridia bacterium]|nr:PHP domain-containing protein [Clostridia bacterium]
MNFDNYIFSLNSKNKRERLDALRKIKELIDSGVIKREKCEGIANNHIHTTYSFSPYSPTAAVFMAWQAGLETCGIIDHDGVGGCKEFIEASEIIGIPATCGLECRVRTDGTKLYGRMINNTEQKSVAYVVMHAIPPRVLNEIDEIFKPLREKRNERNIKMCQRLNDYLDAFDIHIDYEQDVLPLSEKNDGGTVTERHICLALVHKLKKKLHSSTEIIAFLIEKLNIPISKLEEKRILDENPEYHDYDILSVIRKNLVESFYIDAYEECLHIKDFVSITKKYGCISAYAYLGDVIDTSEGDKKAQRFEDSYIEELMQELKKLGFDAITYMPSRNTRYQLSKVMELCQKHEFLEINGEDINSPRQKFSSCLESDEMFDHLKYMTYALIGHEMAVTDNIENSMFSDSIKSKFPKIKDRIDYYKEIARRKNNGT